MSGYDYELVDELIKELECPVCFLLMKDAVELTCGHSLCSECLNQWELKTAELKQTFDCPQCKAPIKKRKVKVNHTINRIIRESIKIKCDNHQQGCDWKDVISNIKDHLEKHCMYALVKCEHSRCDEKILRSSLSQHVQSECIYRTVECQFCKMLLEFLDVDNHDNACPQMTVSCPSPQCQQQMKRNELAMHQESCDFQSVRCEFFESGCTDQIPRNTLAVHMKESVHKHLYLMMKQQKANGQKSAEERDKLSFELQQHKQELSELRLEFNQFKAMSELERQIRSDTRLIFEGMHTFCQKLKEEEQQLSKNIIDVVEQFDKSFQLLEGGINVIKAKIDDKVKKILDDSTEEATKFIDLDIEDTILKAVNNRCVEIDFGLDTSKLKENLRFQEYFDNYRRLKEKIITQLTKVHRAGYETTYSERFEVMYRQLPVNQKMQYNNNKYLLKLRIMDNYDDDWSVKIMKKYSFFDVGMEKHDDVFMYKINKTIGLHFADDIFCAGIPSVTVCNPRQLYKLRLPSTSKDDMTVRINFSTLEKSKYVLDQCVLLRIEEVPKMEINSEFLNRINSFSDSFKGSSSLS